MKKFIFRVILISLVVFIGIAFCNKDVGNFCSTYNLQVISAIATIFIASISLFQAKESRRGLKENRKEKEELERGEIVENIINPLKQSVKNIIANIKDELFISSWKWYKIKDKKFYLVGKPSFKIIEKEIEEFHTKLSRVGNLYVQCHQNLKKLIIQEIKKNSTLIEEKPEIETTEIDLILTMYKLLIGGEATEITFFRLIFKKKNLDEEIEEEQSKRFERGSQSPNQKREKEEFILNGKSIFKARETKVKVFNEIVFSIFEELDKNKNKKLKKYIDECKALSEKAYKLKDKFDHFFKKL